MKSYHIDCHAFCFLLIFFHFLKPKEMLFFIVVLVHKIDACFNLFFCYLHISPGFHCKKCCVQMCSFLQCILLEVEFKVEKKCIFLFLIDPSKLSL